MPGATSAQNRGGRGGGALAGANGTVQDPNNKFAAMIMTGGMGNDMVVQDFYASSVAWQKTLKDMTGSDKMDASAVLEYFAPLQQWLKQQNEGKTCGWQANAPTSAPPAPVAAKPAPAKA